MHYSIGVLAIIGPQTTGGVPNDDQEREEWP